MTRPPGPAVASPARRRSPRPASRRSSCGRSRWPASPPGCGWSTTRRAAPGAAGAAGCSGSAHFTRRQQLDPARLHLSGCDAALARLWSRSSSLALYLAIYPMLAAGLAWRFASPRRRATRTPPGAALCWSSRAAWIVTEWLRGTMFTGYPWNPLGVIWVPSTGVAALLALIGTYALSGMTICAAGAAAARGGARAAGASPRRGFGRDAGRGVGVGRAARPSATRRPASPNAPRVRIVQPNLGEEQRPRADYAETNLARARGAQRHARPRPAADRVARGRGALSSSRTAIRRNIITGGVAARWSARRIAAPLGPHDVRAHRRQRARSSTRPGDLASATNSIFAIDAHGAASSAATTRRISCRYGEYLPMRPLLSRARPVAAGARAISISRPARGRATIALPGFGTVGMQICYEIIFSGQVVDPAHRPALIFNPSNDAWFGTWGPPQHLAQARLRAIEEGLPIMRATPTGISAMIDADGRLLATDPAAPGRRDRTAAARRRSRRRCSRGSATGWPAIVAMLLLAGGRCHPPAAARWPYKESFICGSGAARDRRADQG